MNLPGSTAIPPEKVASQHTPITVIIEQLHEFAKTLPNYNEFQKSFYTLPINLQTHTLLEAILIQYKDTKNDTLYTNLSKILIEETSKIQIPDKTKHNMFILGVVLRFLISNYGNETTIKH